jgi:arginine N-succinyltransferase
VTFLVRPARLDDLGGLYRMAKSTGGGFTNLPPDRPTLKARLKRSVESFAREEDVLGDDLFLFVPEDRDTGKLHGTCLIYARIGSEWPFYSYRIGTITQQSKELDRTFRAEMLTLCTDLDGSSEVGGLFLDPEHRSAGIGKLLARSRYLFMQMHRARFADRTIAELRGAHDDAGNSPFWDGLAGRFFGMSFREADDFNAIHGNQFIADLMPKHPIYTAMLPESARAVMGVPHRSGRPAMRMLEKEGFAWENYIDIFDGGPTLTVVTDRIRTICEARNETIVAIGDPGEGEPHILAHGRLAGFRACAGEIAEAPGGVAIDRGAAGLLGVSPRDRITFAPG